MNHELTSFERLWMMAVGLLICLGCAIILSSCREDAASPTPLPGNGNGTSGTSARFLSFQVNGQTLPAAIKPTVHKVRLEVGRQVDITQLIPTFHVPAGSKVLVDGVEQVSGSAAMNFTKPVSYQIKDATGAIASWEVSVVPLGCRILIDGSHDGGVWWFPQYENTGFDASSWHQGQPFAEMLRGKGFEVTELGRGTVLSDEMFFGYYIVIRAGGFQAYTPNEVAVYQRLIDRGMNLVLFGDHMKYDPKDELADLVGLQVAGTSYGYVSSFADHAITAGVSSLFYNAGTVITNADSNPNIQVLGWLGAHEFGDLNSNGVQDTGEPFAPPVMAMVTYQKSKVFYIGDTNGLLVQPQPFINNLVSWVGTCF
jgi:hypothetical protein